jgi:hypothetical protein
MSAITTQLERKHLNYCDPINEVRVICTTYVDEHFPECSRVFRSVIQLTISTEPIEGAVKMHVFMWNKHLVYEKPDVSSGVGHMHAALEELFRRLLPDCADGKVRKVYVKATPVV